MAYTATVVSATEVTQDGQQIVVIDIKNDDDEVILTHSIVADVEVVKDTIIDFLKNYKAKATSNKRVKEGDSWSR